MIFKISDDIPKGGGHISNIGHLTKIPLIFQYDGDVIRIGGMQHVVSSMMVLSAGIMRISPIADEGGHQDVFEYQVMRSGDVSYQGDISDKGDILHQGDVKYRGDIFISGEHAGGSPISRYHVRGNIMRVRRYDDSV